MRDLPSTFAPSRANGLTCTADCHFISSEWHKGCCNLEVVGSSGKPLRTWPWWHCVFNKALFKSVGAWTPTWTECVFFRIRALTYPLGHRLMLGLLGIDLNEPALSACFLTGLCNAKKEDELLALLKSVAHAVGVAWQEVIREWRKLYTCGLVKVGQGGAGAGGQGSGEGP